MLKGIKSSAVPIGKKWRDVTSMGCHGTQDRHCQRCHGQLSLKNLVPCREKKKKTKTFSTILQSRKFPHSIGYVYDIL